MVEACGYRQHGDFINALKHENKHAPRQMPGKSNIIDSNQSEVIRELQNQIAILTNLVQDFSDFSCNQKTVPVKTDKRIELESNTEYLTFGKLPNYVTVGLQGIWVNIKFSVNHKFLVAKSLVVVPVNRKVPIKLLISCNVKTTTPKGKNIAEFSTLSNEYTCVAMSEKSEIPEVQNIQPLIDFEALDGDSSDVLLSILGFGLLNTDGLNEESIDGIVDIESVDSNDDTELSMLN
ncbi:unnamed protein product [Mytilus edulis]|uniref:Uncharacterized protein n=1 Tax=Mytilus edulis TaxID=6550 RepID=A0A8S3QVZ4_MYTED|nr:unnamed protein product [Mytilus edulis]